MGDPNPVPAVRIVITRLNDDELTQSFPEDFCQPGRFARYQSLEDTVFALVGYDREKYYLHFHVESHDNCDVFVKPNFWNEGSYFRPNLLTDNALCLIAHFQNVIKRRNGPASRVTRKTAASTSISAPKAIASTARDATTTDLIHPAAPNDTLPITSPRTAITSSTISTPSAASNPSGTTVAPSKCLNRHGFRLDPFIGAIIIDRDTYTGPVYEDRAIDENDELEHLSPPKKVNKNYLQTAFHDSNQFKPVATSELPEGITVKSWEKDFEEGTKRYLGAGCFNLSTTDSNRKAHWFRKVHIELIEGKYGMVSAKPCTSCAQSGRTCRVYHADCYRWAVTPVADKENALSSQSSLGWNCSNCRRSAEYSSVSCDAQFTDAARKKAHMREELD